MPRWTTAHNMSALHGFSFCTWSGCWTYDQKVVSSIPGRVAVKWLLVGCLRTGEPSRYITDTKVNSAFHPSGVNKSNTGLHGWGQGGGIDLCLVAANTAV